MKIILTQTYQSKEKSNLKQWDPLDLVTDDKLHQYLGFLDMT